MKKLPRLLLEAANAARFDSNDFRTHFLGCVAVRSDGAIVRARNASNKLPVQDGHAECRALRKVDKGATFYVARVKKDGGLGLAKPCPHCQLRMRLAGVARCYFTIDDHTFGTMEF